MRSDEFFDQIESHFNAKLPFVVYRKPLENNIKSFLQKSTTLNVINDFKESGFVFSPFDSAKTSVLLPLSDCNIIETDFLIKEKNDTFYHDFLSSNIDKKFHIQLVENAISKIKMNEFQKVVVSRSETISLSNPKPLHLLENLLNTYESAFVYCFYHPEIGCWLGATPETLLNIEGNRLITMALAGTQQFLDTKDVIWKEKEKNEQQLVTDFISASLKPSVTNLHISERETIRAGNVVHLKTTIRANVKPQDSNLKNLIQALHPTPAVCGLPKEQAKKFILASENYDREFYTGFLGELNLKEKKSRNSNRQNVENNAYSSVKTISNLYVNLRCTQIKQKSAIIYVGGGITKDSIAESEWEETVSKSYVIKSVLSL